MELSISKSARQFGYVIWNSKTDNAMKSFLNGKNSVNVTFNGITVGVKNVDWKYHRISIGYKFTRGLPETASMFILKMNGDTLEVSTNG